MAVAVEGQRRAVFAHLQPIMGQILPAGTNEQLLLNLLKGLHGLLSENATVQKHLGLCFDYVWFPFQYILTSISATRKLSRLPSQQPKQNAALIPCLASSLVAERALQCVKRILELAAPPSLSSTLAILAQLSELTHIDRQCGNEQMMHDILSSISVLLKAVKHARWKEHPQEMRVWAVTVGMLFHGLLGIIESERLGMGYGAPKLATSASRAAQEAMAALESQPDRAAYYLPGLASNACAVLIDSSSQLPASCHAATCTLLHETLLLTLNPKTVSGLPSQHPPASTPSTPHAPLNAAAALAALAHPQQVPAQPASTSSHPGGARHPGAAAQSQPEAPADPFTTPRNAAWVHTTCKSLSSMLPQAIRAASMRKATSVRSAAAHLATRLLQTSAAALQPSLTRPLLRTALLLSADSAPAVSGPCVQFLHATAARTRCDASEQLWAELTDMAEGAAQELSSGSAWREESLLTSARLLSAALTALPGFIPESSAVSGPVALLGIVCKLIELDLPGAALWLQGHAAVAVPDTAGSLCWSSTALAADESTSGGAQPGGAGAHEQGATDSGTQREGSKGPQMGADGADGGGDSACDRHESFREVANSGTGKDAASSAAARALQALPAALQKAAGSSGGSPGMPFGLKRMEQEETFHAVMSVAAAAGCMCVRSEPAQGGARGPPERQSASALDAVEHVRSELQLAAPRASRMVKDTDYNKLVGSLLQQSQLLTTLSAFLSGCTLGLSGPGACHEAGSAAKASTGAARADSHSTTATANNRDSTPDQREQGDTEDAFYLPLTVSLRSITRSASKVMETGAGALAALYASEGHSAHFCAGSGTARDLSTACALHAYAFSTLVDCMGSNAASVLRRDDATLRAVLLPLLQAAAAAPPLVAARAASAITSLCTCLGFPGWAELVSANLDYVVDGLVLHIRNPMRFPHAPHLLAALLTSSSVSSALLPALAEPASAAVQGLSILSRAARPQHVSAFLGALTPIAAAVATQAHQIKLAADAALAALRARKAAEESLPEGANGGCGAAHGAGELAQEGEGTGDGGFREAAEFFGDCPKRRGVVLPREELAELDRRRWTTYAAAELSSAIAGAASPLLVAEDLKEALTALRFLTDADDVDTRDIVEALEVSGAAQLPGEIERLLPQVHITWGFIVPGLRAHAQPARLEATLALIAHVAVCSGSFISKRMQTDVLPQLKRVISGSTGIATRAWMRSGGAMRAVEDVAPGTAARCQVLAFNTLQRMCQNSSSREALTGSVGELSQSLVELMSKGSTGAPVAEQCAATLKGLAAVDQDAVSSVLKPVSSNSSQALTQLAADVSSTKTSKHAKAILDAVPDDVQAELADLEIDAGSSL